MNPRFRLRKLKREVAKVIKEVELLRTDDRLVRSLVADDEKSRQDQIAMVLIESEDPENLENTNQGEVALEQPKNDYLERMRIR